MVRLTLDNDTVDLDDWTEGFVVTGVDIGPPEPRTVAYDLPGADGDADLTRLVGSRAITVSLSIVEGPHPRQVCLDRLAPFLHPRARPVLDLETDGPARRVTVRSEPSSQQWSRPGYLGLSIGFKTVGSPYFLGEVRELVTGPVETIQGRIYPLVHDRVYPPIAPDPTVTLFNGGTHDAAWSAEIVGPADGVRLGTEHGTVALPGLVLAPGQVARVDPPRVTVAGAPQFGVVDISDTTWFRLPPGSTAVLFHAGSYDPYTSAKFTWSDTYL